MLAELHPVLRLFIMLAATGTLGLLVRFVTR